MRIEELQAVPQDRWATTQVGDGMRSDFPTVKLDSLVRDALTLMEDADVDLLPVLDGDTFVGVVTTTEILKLDEILGQTSGEPNHASLVPADRTDGSTAALRLLAAALRRPRRREPPTPAVRPV
jgi:CBS-domain-containing membrane protein